MLEREEGSWSLEIERGECLSLIEALMLSCKY
jgi:hypothetical protein